MKFLFFMYCACAALLLEARPQPGLDTLTFQFSDEGRGEILFAGSRDSLDKDIFSNHYLLTPNSNLFFAFTLQKPLTYYQKIIAPKFTDTELFGQGNFQFTLWIDGKVIYRSNLFPGAPMQKQQNLETTFKRPLMDNIQGQGSWSESFWNRFLYHGGEKALTDGKHHLRMEIRPYVTANNLLVGDIIASGELQLEVRLNPVIDPDKYKLRKPIVYPGLNSSKAKFDSDKIQQLKGMIAQGVFKKINGIVVLKEGNLLIEEYFNGTDRDSLHDARSVGKTFASTLMGMAIDDGYIKDEYQTLEKFYDFSKYQHTDTGKSKTTIYELLTMSSGFDGNDQDPTSPGNEENMYPSANWVEFTLNLPFRKALKQQWHYFTAGVVVLGDIINRHVKGGLEQYAQKRLFAPLEITKYRWEYTPQGVPNTAGGIRMNALDFAKYGQLYKNGGKWKGEQILSQEWVSKSLSKQLIIPERNQENYSYLFWNKYYRVAHNTYDAYYCAGNGGNYIIVMKNIPYVIVIIASAYGQPYAHKQADRIVSEYLLPALINGSCSQIVDNKPFND